MPELYNNFEGGVDDATVLTTDTFGGNAFGTVFLPTSGTVQYETTGAYERTTCLKVRVAGTGGDTGCCWTEAQMGSPVDFYTSVLFKSDATPNSASAYIMAMRRTSDSSFQAGIVYQAVTGKLLIFNASQVAASAASTTVITPGQWYMLDIFVHCATTALGYITVRIYSDPHSDTITETLDSSGSPWNFTATTVGKLNFGAVGSGANWPHSTDPSKYVYFDKPRAGRTTNYWGRDLSFYNSVPPTTIGALAVGGTLTANVGTWTPTPASYQYYWHRADDALGTNLVEIGATGSTYTLAAADVGKYIRAGVIPVP